LWTKGVYEDATIKASLISLAFLGLNAEALRPKKGNRRTTELYYVLNNIL